jgi:hypothetical protein
MKNNPNSMWEGSQDYDPFPKTTLERCLIGIQADRNISLNNVALMKLNIPIAVIVSFNSSSNILSIREATETDKCSIKLNIFIAESISATYAEVQVSKLLEALNYPKEPHTLYPADYKEGRLFINIGPALKRNRNNQPVIEDTILTVPVPKKLKPSDGLPIPELIPIMESETTPAWWTNLPINHNTVAAQHLPIQVQTVEIIDWRPITDSNIYLQLPEEINESILYEEDELVLWLPEEEDSQIQPTPVPSNLPKFNTTPKEGGSPSHKNRRKLNKWDSLKTKEQNALIALCYPQFKDDGAFVTELWDVLEIKTPSPKTVLYQTLAGLNLLGYLKPRKKLTPYVITEAGRELVLEQGRKEREVHLSQAKALVIEAVTDDGDSNEPELETKTQPAIELRNQQEKEDEALSLYQTLGTIQAVAERLGETERTIRNWIKQAKLAHFGGSASN